MRSRTSRTAGFLVMLLLAAAPLRAQKTRIGTPGPDDGPQLVTPGPDAVVRYPVAHQHAMSGCMGYLYFSKQTIRFEVLHPERDKSHSFQYPLADLVVAKQWIFMGSAMPEVEYKFRDGRVFHFFRTRRKSAEGTSEKFVWDDVLPYEALLDAATNLNAVLAQIQANSPQTASGANASSSAASAIAASPPDDTAAMDSAGLDVPPPPPWGRPAAASATKPASPGNGGRP